MVRIAKTVGLLIITVVVAYSPVSMSAESWVADEILQQLSELRRDYSDLKKQVEGLSSTVSQLQASAGGIQKNKNKISLGEEPSMGDVNAQIVMVEFTDYQCSFCRRHSQKTLPQLKETYIDTGKLRYVIKDFPLGFHSQAPLAAVAANCAWEQGEYWKMHDLLFSSGVRLSRETYVSLADKMTLDLPAFELCLNDPKKAKEVDEDFAFGSSIGVQGTPAFFIGKLDNGSIVNGRLIRGAQSFKKFSIIIDTLLAAN